MDADLWRIPTLLGVTAACGLGLFATGVVASIVLRRWPSTISKGAITSALAVLAFSAAITVRRTAASIAQTLEIDVSYVDPGPAWYLAPVAFAAVAFAVSRRVLTEDWTGRAAVLFYVWLAGFTAANIINWCSPGWCETIGFPFVWRSWSDAMITFGDDRFWAIVEGVRHVLGALVNVATFVAGARLLTRAAGRLPRQGRPR